METSSPAVQTVQQEKRSTAVKAYAKGYQAGKRSAEAKSRKGTVLIIKGMKLPVDHATARSILRQLVASL
jgi:cytochrome c-type biogenesis protein CcmH/NrfG